MDDLLEWFKEADGFSQGTKAPHKWVLQAEQEITALRARLAAMEADRDKWFEGAGAHHVASMREAQRADRAEAALEDANASVVAFCAPAAVEYARGMGLPDGHLHPTHYDILVKAGARMDSFTRASQEGEG